ncbi:MAG: rhodanese-like domain-containing protein [Anaerolineales bacterium]|nr:rhodanese-like domain-containing protein [Anaerolineales bacterium]
MKKSATPRKRSAGLNPLWFIIGTVALAVVALAAFALLPVGNTTTLPKEISVTEAATMREAGAFILDVRQPEEWMEYHIPGSTLIPLDQLSARLSEVPRDREIVVVCRSGNRSQQGRDILLQAGFTRVTSMAGGLRRWAASGLPTVSGP